MKNKRLQWITQLQSIAQAGLNFHFLPGFLPEVISASFPRIIVPLALTPADPSP